jgi:hypothetical protein
MTSCSCGCATYAKQDWFRVRFERVPPCVNPRSGGLVQRDPIALRIGDPAESTDTLHTCVFSDARSFAPNCARIASRSRTRSRAGLLGAGPEVLGLGLQSHEAAAVALLLVGAYV